jgi:hypothetical protein
MAISLKHAFTSAKSDGGDATLVRPSNWNAEHNLTMAAARLLGRTTAGDGAAEEIAVRPAAAMAEGTLSLGAWRLAADPADVSAVTAHEIDLPAEDAVWRIEWENVRLGGSAAAGTYFAAAFRIQDDSGDWSTGIDQTRIFLGTEGADFSPSFQKSFDTALIILSIRGGSDSWTTDHRGCGWLEINNVGADVHRMFRAEWIGMHSNSGLRRHWMTGTAQRSLYPTATWKRVNRIRLRWSDGTTTWSGRVRLLRAA